MAGRPRTGSSLKRVFTIRLAPEMAAEIRALAGPRGFSAAVEQGLRLWAARERRKAAKPDKLARHLAPPAAREIAAREGS